MRPAVPEWRSRGVLVRPGVGCTTDPASAAKPINRGARSGAAIRLRQMQAVVVSARCDHQSESPSGVPGWRPRSGPPRDGNVIYLENQGMRGGLSHLARGRGSCGRCTSRSFACVGDLCVNGRDLGVRFRLADSKPSLYARGEADASSDPGVQFDPGHRTLWVLIWNGTG